MRKNWPYFIVASFLNALLVTAVFLEFKLRGIAVFDPVNRTTGFPSWNEINPFQFAGGMFVVSFLIIVTIIGVKDLVSGIFNRLHSFNQSLAGTTQNQLAIDNRQ
jgi:hypothetical protein